MAIPLKIPSCHLGPAEQKTSLAQSERRGGQKCVIVCLCSFLVIGAGGKCNNGNMERSLNCNVVFKCFFSILYHNQHILSNIYTFWHQALLAIVLMLCELEDRRNNIRISTWIRQQDTWKFFLSIMTVQKSYTHSDKSLFFTPALNIIIYL